MWTDAWYCQKLVAGADVLCTVPTIFQHATTSIAAAIPYGANCAAISVGNQYANSTSTAYTGRVRCKGIKFTVTYTGTELNKGGTIYPFHNPQKTSLLCQVETGVAADYPATQFDLAAEITQNSASFGCFRMGDQFSFVWRPNSLEFQDVQTYYPYEAPAVAAAASGNPSCYDYLPPQDCGSQVATKGWTTGFHLIPAAGTQGAASQYFLDFEADYDLEVYRGGTSSGGVAAIPATRMTYADPAAHARIANALGAVHHARTTSAHKAGAVNMAVHGAERMVGKLAKSAAVEAIASKLASVF